MQQALHRSSLVPRGFVVEDAHYGMVIRPLLRSGRPEPLVCVHHAEPFPGVSIAGIDDT